MSDLMDTIGRITSSASADFNLKRENANIDGDSSMGSMLRVGSEAYKEWNKKNIVGAEYAAAHDAGDIHIHDLDFDALTTTCTQIDIKKLFKGGFNTGHGFLREPNSIQTAAALAAIAIQSNQNDQHGGQSIPNFDYGLAPYIGRSYIKNLKKVFEVMGMEENAEYNAIIADLEDCLADGGSVLELVNAEYGGRSFDVAMKWTEKDTFQAMEGFVHNLNTMHSRAGAQVPFSSINYGTDTSPEGRMLIKTLLLAEDAGLGNGETPIFPIHIFKMREGYTTNPGDPNHDLFKLACRVSAKRLFPNFSNMDAPFNKVYLTPDGDPDHEVAYMGCRTRVMANRNGEETTFGRGNLSFTSVNLPRLGIRAKGNLDAFWDSLDEMISLVFGQLEERFEVQCKRKVYNYPFLMGQGVWRDSDKLGPDDEVRPVLKHGTLTLGFIGLAECLKALIGFHHGESDIAYNLAIEIVKHMRKRCDEEGERTGLNVTLIATPAEGLAGRFVKIDREMFGEIPGVTDRDYYTNSFHIPVYFPCTAFRKIKLEAPFHDFTNGGHISYVELDGDPLNNIDAFEQIVLYMVKCGMGYGSINHPVDRDPVCGYTGVIGDTCPKCGRDANKGKKIERIRRITGYLVGSLERFNDGKAAEERDRVKHYGVKEA